MVFGSCGGRGVEVLFIVEMLGVCGSRMDAGDGIVGCGWVVGMAFTDNTLFDSTQLDLLGV
jgi:hypothetical protein